MSTLDPDIMKAALRIREAVENKGPHPGYHDEKLRQLAMEWPHLFNAIIDLQWALDAKVGRRDGHPF